MCAFLCIAITVLAKNSNKRRLRPPGRAGFVACAFRCLGSEGIRLLIRAFTITHSGSGHILVGSVIILAHRLGRVRACGLVFRFMVILVTFEVTGSAIRAGLAPTLIGFGTSDVMCPMLRSTYVSICFLRCIFTCEKCIFTFERLSLICVHIFCFCRKGKYVEGKSS